ncbi:hypothetical protein V6Z11_1Z072600 [Gossypium hirsutum]
MASDSSPANFNNGPSSPDDSFSSPIANTSSPAHRRRRGRRQASTPSSAAGTPPPNPSRFANSASTPTPARSTRRGRRPGPATSTSPAVAATPSSTDDFSMPSSEGGEDGGGDPYLQFIKHFRDPQELSNDIYGEGKYTRLIHRVLEVEGEWIDVDAHDVFNYDSDLYNKMRYPLEVLAIFDIVLMDIVSVINPYIEKMVSLKGMVIRCSSIIPEIREAVFRCIVCGYHSEPVVVDRGRISEPTSCLKQECLAKNSMALVHNRCRFADKQIVRLQETPDEIPEGGTPHTVTGIYRALSVRVGPTQRTVKSLFKAYIHRLPSHKKTDKSRMTAEDPMEVDKGSQRVDDDVQFDEDKVEELKELSNQPDLYERLTRSLCQLFGGNALKLLSGASFRGDINILLVGDLEPASPSFSNTYTSLLTWHLYQWKGSSAVGLTAYVAKDPETGETVLESGALVLSDRGICCIDEFDKMSDNARSMLHEVMEQQTVSIAKAGIIASLNARTSVLACANPSGSRYNPRLSVIDNIHLPPTCCPVSNVVECAILIVFVVLIGTADEQTDRRLAKPIVSLHFEDTEIAEHDVIDLATLTAYLTRGYVEMRKRGNFPGSSKKVITATPRQIESLIRLSEALARIRFSETVEMRDVTEAFRLLEVAMQQSATDHSTGNETIDMDLITTGVSASERMRRESVLSATRNIIMDKLQLGGPSMRLLELLDEMKKQTLALRTAVATLASEGFVVLHGDSVKRM